MLDKCGFAAQFNIEQGTARSTSKTPGYFPPDFCLLRSLARRSLREGG